MWSFRTTLHAWSHGCSDRAVFTAVFESLQFLLRNLLDDLWVVTTRFNWSLCLFHFHLDLLDFGSLYALLWIILQPLVLGSTSTSWLLEELSCLQIFLLFGSSSRSASTSTLVALLFCIDGRRVLVVALLVLTFLLLTLLVLTLLMTNLGWHSLVWGISVHLEFPDWRRRLVVWLRYTQVTEVNLISKLVLQFIVS